MVRAVHMKNDRLPAPRGPWGAHIQVPAGESCLAVLASPAGFAGVTSPLLRVCSLKTGKMPIPRDGQDAYSIYCGGIMIRACGLPLATNCPSAAITPSLLMPLAKEICFHPDTRLLSCVAEPSISHRMPV